MDAQDGGPPLAAGAPSPLALLLVFLGGLALLWHPSILLNDEIAQAAGLHALSEGRLAIDSSFPPGYRALGERGFWHAALPCYEGIHPAAFCAQADSVSPVGSNFLNLLALPVLLALKPLAAAAGATAAMALVAALLAGSGLAALLRWRQPGLPPSKRWGWPAALAVGLAAGAPFLRKVPAAPFLEVGALELVNLAAAAASAVLLFGLLRRSMDWRFALGGAVLYLVGTPALFWGLSAKYHALSMALCVLAMWAYRDGHRSAPAATGLAFGAAGLATWHHFPTGMVLLGSLALVAAPALRRPAGLAARLGAAAAGLAVGLLGLFAELQALRGAGLEGRYVAAVPLAGGWGPPAVAVAAVASVGSTLSALWDFLTRGLVDGVAYFLRYSVLADPLGALDSLRQNVLWFDATAISPALSMACAVPLTVAAGLTLASRRWRSKVPPVFRWWGPLYGLLLFGMGGQRLLDIGSGYDARHVAAWWPLLVPLLMPPLVELWARVGPGRAWTQVSWRVAAAFPLYLVPVFLYHKMLHRWGAPNPVSDALVPPRVAGAWAALALAWTGAWSLVPRGEPERSRDRRQFGRALVLAAAVGVAYQLYVKVAAQNIPLEWGSGPFLAWPLELVGAAATWLWITV